MDDIARALGITKGTVSKALSGAEDVSEATRRLVLEKAVEMGYMRIPRGSVRPKLAVFVGSMAYKKPEDFGYDIVVGFRKMAEPAGYAVEVVPLTPALQRETHYDSFMMRGDYRGALFLGLSLPDPWMREFETCRFPAVLYDNHVPGNPRISHVGVDNDEGMRMLISHLTKLGHKRIGHLGSARSAYVYRQRCDSFFLALREHKLDDRRSLACNVYHMSECITRHLPRLLEQGCTAIVCSHDKLAASVLTQLGDMGIRVPEDISVVGFDDLPLSRTTTPPLTTVRQNRTELGKSAFYALSSLMNGVPISTLLLHAELVVRGSSGKAPARAPFPFSL